MESWDPSLVQPKPALPPTATPALLKLLTPTPLPYLMTLHKQIPLCQGPSPPSPAPWLPEHTLRVTSSERPSPTALT